MLLLNHHTTEQELLGLLRDGHAEAFEEIFRRHWHEVFQLAQSKLQDKSEAEEVVQSIFTTLWEKRDTLYITNLSFYLHAAVRNRVINLIRSKITQRTYWEYYRQYIPHAETSTERRVLYDTLHEAVDRALVQLPEKTRQVFRLNRLEGHSVPEIARRLRLSEKAIEYHLTRSLKELRVLLKDFILLATFSCIL